MSPYHWFSLRGNSVKHRSRRLGYLALVTSIAVGLSAFAWGCGGDGGDSNSESLDQVTVQLDYVPRGNHAMFYVGQKEGFFEKQGIEVTNIQEGTGSPDAMRIVSQGDMKFGFGDLPTLATARSQGVPVVALAAVNQKSPLGFCSMADHLKLNGPEDLEGKKVAVDPTGSTFIFYQAFLAANGISRDSVDELTVQPPYENVLIQGKVDIAPCYIDAEVPVIEERTGPDTISRIQGSDFGYKALGSGMFTNEEMIMDNPDVVQRFTNAYMEAFQWVIDHPEEAAQVLADAKPELAKSKDLFLTQINADIEKTFTSSVTEKEGLGYMDGASWDSTVQILEDQDVLAKPIDPADAYTNKFVSKAD